MNLQIAVEEEEYHKWTKEEIDQQLREGGEFYSWWNPVTRKSQAPRSIAASIPRTAPTTPRAISATPAAAEQQQDIPQDQQTYPPLPPSQPNTPVLQNLPTPRKPLTSTNLPRLPPPLQLPAIVTQTLPAISTPPTPLIPPAN